MNQTERVRRAEKAKELLENPYLKECLKDIREGLVLGAETCKWNDIQTQTNIMLSLQLLKNLKAIMEKHITDGKVAQTEIDRAVNPKVKRIA